MSGRLIVGILLAAGAGRRFGGDKLRATLPDGRCLARAAFDALAPAVDRIVAVVRPGDAALAKALRDAGAEICIAPDAALGMGHSLAAGIAAAADADGWLIALGDMPFIGPAARPVAAALRTGAGIARPITPDGPGHPVGFAATHRAELLTLTGDAGARTIIERHRASVVSIPLDRREIHIDIDTPDQLARQRLD